MRNLHLLSASTLALASLALAACGPQQSASQADASGSSLALSQPDSSLDAYAPAAAQLPASAPLRLASAGVERQPYSYIDDAYDLGDAFGDSPPDYTVDYQGSRPWVWRSQAGAYRVVEQTTDGERDYYYRAGADQPFLVRDPHYAYAYDGGELAVVYDSAGRPVAQDVAARDAAVAARYLARARQIYTAAVHDQRQAAQATEWQARRNAVLATQRDWAAEQKRNADWRNWHDQRAHDDQARQQQAALQQERAQRQASAATLAGVAAGAAMQHRQDQAVDQARAQQARADASRAQDEARRQQQAAAQTQSQDRQRQAQADTARQAQAHTQQAQAGAVRRDAQAHQQQAQQDQKAEAARRDQAVAQARQQQAQAHQQQAETSRRDAQAHQQQAQAQAAQAHAKQAQAQQAHVQQAQAGQAQRVQAEAQAHPPQPHGPGHGDKHGPPKPDADKDHDKPKPPGA